MNEPFEMVSDRMKLVFKKVVLTEVALIGHFQNSVGHLEFMKYLDMFQKTKQPNSNGIKVTHSSSLMDGANIFLEKCAERNVRAEKQTL